MYLISNIKSWWTHKTKNKRLAIKMLIWLNLILAFIVFYGGSVVYKELSEPVVPAYAQYKQLTEKIEPMPSEVLDTINYYAQRFGVDPKLALAIVECESKGNTTIIGDYQANMVSVGLWQFQFLTFYGAAKKYGVKNADIRDHRDQTLIAMMLLRDGQKNIWTCGRNLK